MYKFFIRPLLFLFKPETAHYLTFSVFNSVHRLLPGLIRSLFVKEDSRLEIDFCGLKLPNRVGLAAGFDKDAKAIDAFTDLGFGFIEIGTVTPKGQLGNPKPRLFRLPKDKALINRMGFNNGGLDDVRKRLIKRGSKIIVGGNIGKNKTTPNEEAFQDYEKCIQSLHELVDYFVINISSPNTPGLRELQEKEPLRDLLNSVKTTIDNLGYKPVFLKIAPDLTNTQLDDIVEIVKETKTDGIVATNTTIEREPLTAPKNKIEKIGNGGLSGKPLTERSNEIIKYLRDSLGTDFPIIGVGGIMSPMDAINKIKAGADVIQVYTGFIYEGPSFIKNINRAFLKEIKQ